VSFLILGGSFNPVHIGHLILAEEAMEALGADKACLVPASKPPHKGMASGASDADRLAMLRIAARSDERLEIVDCEIRRGGISYTVETLEWFRAERAGEGLPFLLIGDDLAQGFSSWRRPERIAELSRIAIARRDSDLAPDFPYPFLRIENLRVPVSSSLVRERIAAKRSCKHLVPTGVFEYIREKGLYSTEGAEINS
jgi:nicotinate-nucleotide adenylyltransferase